MKSYLQHLIFGTFFRRFCYPFCLDKRRSTHILPDILIMPSKYKYLPTQLIFLLLFLFVLVYSSFDCLGCPKVKILRKSESSVVQKYITQHVLIPQTSLSSIKHIFLPAIIHWLIYLYNCLILNSYLSISFQGP